MGRYPAATYTSLERDMSARSCFLTLLILSAASACTGSGAQAPVRVPALSADSTQRFRDEPLPPTATQGDLALLDQSLRVLHPGVFRYNTPLQWTARVDSLKQWFAQPRSRGESYLAFARLTASVQCGHTYLNFWNQSREVHRWLTDGEDKLPFEYALADDDRWVVTRSATVTSAAAGNTIGAGVLPGDTVLAVNDMPTPRIIASLLPAIRGDGDNDGKRRALLDFRHRKRYEAIDVLLPLILPPVDGRYRVTLRRAGRDTTVSVASMESRVRREQAWPIPPERAPFELTRDGTVAILRVDAFDYGAESNKWSPFVTSTFRTLKRDSVQTLILDLRENEGGSDEGAEFLLRHLIRTPLLVPPLRRFVAYDTVPTNLRPFLCTWEKEFYDRRGRVVARGDGTFDLKDDGSWPKRIPVARDAFAGRIVVLTSYVNSSASHIMLRMLARQPGVTLIGDPTGGSLRAHTGGNLFFAKFPGTGFEVDLPLIAYDWGASNPSGGVQPDIRVPAARALERALQEASGTRR